MTFFFFFFFWGGGGGGGGLYKQLPRLISLLLFNPLFTFLADWKSHIYNSKSFNSNSKIHPINHKVPNHHF
ncbi:hypothetical protein Hanom_Chr10g00923971 [Helianthus anomalus]